MENTENKNELVVIDLRKPLEYTGKTYEKITFDFESLTGKDAYDVQMEMAMKKQGAVIPGAEALNTNYLLGLACKACCEPVGADGFMTLNLRDYNKILETVRVFLSK